MAAAAIPYIVAAGAAVSAIGAIQQGQAASASAKYNANIQEQNAVLLRQQAAEQAEQERRETYMRLGTIRAAQGKGGGAADEGSVLDVLGFVASEGERQRQHVLYGGELQARDALNTAALDRARGRNAVRTSYFQAGAELTQGAGSYYSMTRN